MVDAMPPSCRASGFDIGEGIINKNDFSGVSGPALEKPYSPFSGVIVDHTSPQSFRIDKEFRGRIEPDFRSFGKKGVVADATSQNFLLTVWDVFVQPSTAIARRGDDVCIPSDNLNGLLNGAKAIL
ncbi:MULTISPECIES: hypothetical protein [Rhizobium]|uniref:hypothetical protein n=1 Tax=Rhizobium TaxID=379 RepID=UPI00026ECB9F|nr:MULTISPECIES: hypothetical protein [Rhizobium]EJK87289.1 hypothetical protein PMI03_01300 [Rhizobium sp. AP16]